MMTNETNHHENMMDSTTLSLFSQIAMRTVWSMNQAFDYFIFLNAMARCMARSHIVECGTEHGLSTLAFALTGKRVFAIDIAHLSETREALKRFQNVVFLDGDVCEVGNRLKADGLEFDFVYLDAEHSTEGVLREFDTFAEANTILIHDTVLDPRARRAVELLVEKHPNRQFFTFPFLKGLTLSISRR